MAGNVKFDAFRVNVVEPKGENDELAARAILAGVYGRMPLDRWRRQKAIDFLGEHGQSLHADYVRLDRLQSYFGDLQSFANSGDDLEGLGKWETP